MAQKAIREYQVKRLLQKNLERCSKGEVSYQGQAVFVTPELGLEDLARDNSWLKSEKLAVKPDQLFGKRGKNNLLLIDAEFRPAKAWIEERMGKEIVVHREFDPGGNPLDAGIGGRLTHFIVEPMIPHKPQEEHYLSFLGHRAGDYIFFSTAGGVDVEENRGGLITINVPAGTEIDGFDFETPLAGQLRGVELSLMTRFVRGCFVFYRDLHFSFLEFNPLVVAQGRVVPLDAKARLDDAAAFICSETWGDRYFPAPFGHSPTPEEMHTEELDRKSGSSMKLTIFNPNGRVWTMVAGGGASVIYADQVVDLGFGPELANYGEYSGDPSAEETREYTRTILGLMTQQPAPGGKVFIIGGGIANFTDVSKTFDGIIEALTEYARNIKEQHIRIYVRRGGPNYVAGRARIKEAAQRLGLPMEVHGLEMHMTAIVKQALGALSGGN